MQQTLNVIADSRRAAALLHPTRARVLEELKAPGTAAGAARALDLPRQRVGYHVRELERMGLLEAVGERRRGNFVEKLLQATAKVYVIAPQALGGLGVDARIAQDRMSSAYLVAAAVRAVRDLAILGEKAEAAGKRLSTLTLETDVRFRSAKEQSAFAEELAACLARLCEKYHDESAAGGRRLRFLIGGYPSPGPSHERSPKEGDAS